MTKRDSGSIQWSAMKVAGKVGASFIFPWAPAALDAAEGIYDLYQGDTTGACVNFGSAALSLFTVGLHKSGKDVAVEMSKTVTEETTEEFVKNAVVKKSSKKIVKEVFKETSKQTKTKIAMNVGIQGCMKELGKTSITNAKFQRNDMAKI